MCYFAKKENKPNAILQGHDAIEPLEPLLLSQRCSKLILLCHKSLTKVSIRISSLRSGKHAECISFSQSKAHFFNLLNCGLFQIQFSSVFERIVTYPHVLPLQADDKCNKLATKYCILQTIKNQKATSVAVVVPLTST